MAPPIPLFSGARSRPKYGAAVLLALLCSTLIAQAPAAAARGIRSSRMDAEPSDRRLPPDDPLPQDPRPRHAIVPQTMRLFPTYWLFLDPDPYVVCKEFSLFYNLVPDPARGPGKQRGLFHLMYQRSAGPQSRETLFGHAWSTDLRRWAVDTSAFTVDTTAWNAMHVWSPSLIHHGAKDYLFYTGVDSLGDQRIGYASTDLLDTTDTEWDPQRVRVWQATDTRWAVPEPWTYSYFTQFRDPYVMDDPDLPGRLLLFFEAHDSTDFLQGHGGLVVGIARSEPGTVDVWKDLGYLRSTLVRTTHVGQLESPHLVSPPGTHTGWRLMFSNAGSPPGENGQTTIRFEALAPAASVSDTSAGNWSTPSVLEQYLNNDATVFGWSGSEHLRVGDADFLAGFTAWGPLFQGIAVTRMKWLGSDFTLGGSLTTAVDEYRSPTRDVRLSLVAGAPPTRRVQFAIESPTALDARLEVFDAMGRHLATPLDGHVQSGASWVEWNLSTSGGTSVPNGVYFARLSFSGGVRVAQVRVVR
jgi:hypothetical protein